MNALKNMALKMYLFFGYQPKLIMSTLHDSEGHEIRPEMIQNGQPVAAWTDCRYDWFNPVRCIEGDFLIGIDFAIRKEMPRGTALGFDGIPLSMRLETRN